MRPQQKRQDVRPLELPDMSQEVNIVNAKFTETDPRFRDTDTNQLNKNSEGQISGVENSKLLLIIRCLLFFVKVY